MTKQWWWTRATVAVFVSVLAGCGGGGGGGGGGPSNDGGNAPSRSGLVPAGGPLGAMLAADATLLRVLRPGATWRYAGTSPDGEHASVVTHVAAGNGVAERASNLYGSGVDEVTVQHVTGEVRQRVDLGLPGGEIDFVELRSPVRTNDQIVQVDRRIDEFFDDLDGDGKREGVDAAVWSTVVAEEMLDLNSRRGVRSVRVDTVIALRVRGSTGVVGDVTRGELSVWYAEGIGIVRQSARVPTDAGFVQESIEELDTWDGLTEGLGAMPVVPQRNPLTGAAIGATLAAVAFDRHALMLSLGVDAQTGALRIARATPDAQVTAVLDHPGETLAGVPLLVPDGVRPIHRAGDGVVVIVRQQAAPYGFALLGFDAAGVRRAQPPVPLVDTRVLAVESILAASGGPGPLWLITARRVDPQNDPFTVDLELMGFAPDGTPVAPPTRILSAVDQRHVLSTAIAVSKDRVVADWSVQSGLINPVFTHRYSVFDAGDGRALATRDLNTVALEAVPLADADLLAIATSPGLRYGSASIARLGADSELVVGTPEGLVAEDVTPAWLGDFATTEFAVGAQSIIFTGGQRIRRWPWENNPSTVFAVLDLPVQSGRLADASPVLCGRIPTEGIGDIFNPKALVFADRVLFYGSTGAGASALVSVWRPPR